MGSLGGFHGKNKQTNNQTKKKTACQCRRQKKNGLDLWLKKTLWRRGLQPIPVFLHENLMDRGAWRAKVHRVAKSRAQLKQLSTHTCTTCVTYSWHSNICGSSICMVPHLWIQPPSHVMVFYSIYWKKTWMYVDLHSLKPCCSRAKCIILENRKKESDRSMKRNIKGKKIAKDMCVTVEWSNKFATVVLVKGGER